MDVISMVSAILTSEVSLKNLKKFTNSLMTRLGEKPIKVSVKYTASDGRERIIEVEAQNTDELKAALEQAASFIEER